MHDTQLSTSAQYPQAYIHRGTEGGGVPAMAGELLNTTSMRISPRDAEGGAGYLSIELVNAIGRPLVVFDSAGTMLLQSGGLTRLLENEPGCRAIIDAAREMASALSSEARSKRLGEQRGSWAVGRAATVRPHRRGYTLAPFLAPPGVFALAASAVVIVERASKPAQVDLDQVGKDLQLTPRESQILSLLLARYSNAEIARTLGVSSHTARHHIERVCRKAHVSGRSGLRSTLILERTG